MASVMISQGNGVPEMTPQHHANHEVKTRFVDSIFAKDWDTVRSLTHPEFELREPDALPYGGIWKGFDGFRQCWEMIPTSSHIAERLDTLATYFTESPDSIIVELDFRGKRRDNGEPIASKVMEQFEFRDGKVSAIVLYWYNIPPMEKPA